MHDADVVCLGASERTEWVLRHDHKRTLLCDFDRMTCSVKRISVVHPLDAITLALFDGRRSIKSVRDTLCSVFSLSNESAGALIAKILSRWDFALEHRSETRAARSYDPLHFVVPATEVDTARKKLYWPISLLFRVAEDCMRDCRYCNVQRVTIPKDELLPLTRWIELAEECGRLGVLSVVLSGGDPFLHKDICDIVGAFLRNGIHPFLSTKSLVSRATAGRLANLGLRSVQVSVDAASEQTADFLTNSRGALRAAMQTIQYFVEAGVAITTNTVVTHCNADEVSTLVELLLASGVRLVRLAPFARSMYQPYNDSLFLTESDEAAIREVTSRYPAHQVSYTGVPTWSGPDEVRRARWLSRAGCSAGTWGMVIHANGDVTLCDQLPLSDDYIVGNVKGHNILRVWNSPRIEALIHPGREMFKGFACSECEDFDQCHQDRGRCFRDALTAYDSFYAPAPMCPHAPPGRRLS